VNGAALGRSLAGCAPAGGLADDMLPQSPEAPGTKPDDRDDRACPLSPLRHRGGAGRAGIWGFHCQFWPVVTYLSQHRRDAVGNSGYRCDVVGWESPSRILLAWRIRADWRFDPGLLTEVEVKLVPLGAGATRVDLDTGCWKTWLPAKRRPVKFTSPMVWLERNSRTICCGNGGRITALLRPSRPADRRRAIQDSRLLVAAL
jgi:hypothetical protein